MDHQIVDLWNKIREPVGGKQPDLMIELAIFLLNGAKEGYADLELRKRFMTITQGMALGKTVGDFLNQAKEDLDERRQGVRTKLETQTQRNNEMSSLLKTATKELETQEKRYTAVQSEHKELNIRKRSLQEQRERLDSLWTHYHALKQINDGLLPDTKRLLEIQGSTLVELRDLLAKVYEHLEAQMTLLREHLAADARIAAALEAEGLVTPFVELHAVARVVNEIRHLQEGLEGIDKSLYNIVAERDIQTKKHQDRIDGKNSV
ncbi:MAG: hypothetical protein HQL80_10285 [Magnetococcales bacterium]|nr:hypothetical protein [Magnetococcales bacterium]